MSLALLCASAHGQDVADAWLLSVGGEIDEDEGYRIDAGVSWLLSDNSSVTLLAGTADTSTDFNKSYSRAATLGADHSFGVFGVSGDVRWWGDRELFESTTLAGSFYLRQSGWRMALRGELRQSDFEPFSFEAEIPIRNQLVPVAGTADCSLDNSAYGASLSHTGKALSVLISAMQYQYSATDCSLTDVVLPPQAGDLPPVRREIFRRIANAVLLQGAHLLGSQLTRENGFLDYSVWGSIVWRSGLRSYGLEYFHDREEFEGFEADTLIGSVTFPVSTRLDLEFRLGATDSDLEGTVSFLGLMLYAYLGG
jgi:hypothetical protein